MGLGRFRQEASFATEDVLSTSRVEQTAVEKDHKIREICKISTLIFIRRRSYQIYTYHNYNRSFSVMPNITAPLFVVLLIWQENFRKSRSKCSRYARTRQSRIDARKLANPSRCSLHACGASISLRLYGAISRDKVAYNVCISKKSNIICGTSYLQVL